MVPSSHVDTTQPLTEDVGAVVIDVTFPNSKIARLSQRWELDVVHTMTAFLWLTEITQRWCGDEVTMGGLEGGDSILSAGTCPVCVKC